MMSKTFVSVNTLLSSQIDTLSGLIFYDSDLSPSESRITHRIGFNDSKIISDKNVFLFYALIFTRLWQWTLES